MHILRLPSLFCTKEMENIRRVTWPDESLLQELGHLPLHFLFYLGLSLYAGLDTGGASPVSIVWPIPLLGGKPGGSFSNTIL